MFKNKPQPYDNIVTPPAVPYGNIETPCPAVPSLTDQLRSRRADKIKAANELDREIAALDSEITWLERNPKGQEVVKQLLDKPW